ncbi:MAG: hypothetical protein SW019_04170 [Actinomycetota bacterium]|nr:hypothetical protein [Actinomycetota bacterium]
MTSVGSKGALSSAVALVGVVFLAAGCSQPPAPDGTANAAAAQPVTGTVEQWQDAVCRDDSEGTSGTRHTVSGSSCVPHDGDGIVNFDHFDSAASMDSMLSWAPSPHVATTVVDGRPLAIWTPSGEAEDLAPLKNYGFTLASYQTPALARSSDRLPAAVPSADVVTIPPNQFGYVAVATASGDTQCMVETTFVGCQTAGGNWQQHADGSGPYHGVRINADGTGSWVDGNLGAAAPTTLTATTYRALGWTIASSGSELRFTNDATGHGAVVSVLRVQPF